MTTRTAPRVSLRRCHPVVWVASPTIAAYAAPRGTTSQRSRSGLMSIAPTAIAAATAAVPLGKLFRRIHTGPSTRIGRGSTSFKISTARTAAPIRAPTATPRSALPRRKPTTTMAPSATANRTRLNLRQPVLAGQPFGLGPELGPAEGQVLELLTLSGQDEADVDRNQKSHRDQEHCREARARREPPGDLPEPGSADVAHGFYLGGQWEFGDRRRVIHPSHDEPPPKAGLHLRDVRRSDSSREGPDGPQIAGAGSARERSGEGDRSPHPRWYWAPST